MLFIVVIGLILVALMVYTSTRIKRMTAAAFEAETVETDDFVIEKPDGFLHVINGDAQYAFETYSKEFGGPGAENVRRATATVTVFTGTSVANEAVRLVSSGNKVLEDRSEVISEVKYRLIETRSTVNDVEFRNLFKLASRGDKTFVFTITTIADTTEDQRRDIEAMRDSFAIKTSEL